MKPLLHTFVPLILLITTALAGAAGEELIRNGDFGSLDGWEPFETAENRAGESTNSFFDSVYPNNGQSVRLSGLSKKRDPYLSQSIDSVSSGKVDFNIDFFLFENSEDAKEVGWGVSLNGGQDQKIPVTGLSISTRVRLKGESSAGGKLLLFQKFSSGQWYHFHAVIDLEKNTWAGELMAEDGATDSFVDEKFQPPGETATEISGLRIAPLGRDGEPMPVLFDNISLRPVTE